MTVSQAISLNLTGQFAEAMACVNFRRVEVKAPGVLLISTVTPALPRNFLPYFIIL
jgi:hypothetical protein